MLKRRFFERALSRAADLISGMSRRNESGSSATSDSRVPAEATALTRTRPVARAAAEVPSTDAPTTADRSVPPVGEPSSHDAPVVESASAHRAAQLAEESAAHHQRGLAHARMQRWNWAQRELEAAVRLVPDAPARDDLETVRAIRRHLRTLVKRPRDAEVRVSLGKCYFELDLGDEAESEFRRAINLDPDSPVAYYFLALEYCYRGENDEAERIYQRAQALAPDLPPFSTLLAEYEAVQRGDDVADPQQAVKPEVNQRS